jgi:hypothetical protein
MAVLFAKGGLVGMLQGLFARRKRPGLAGQSRGAEA